jgi:hypothetical protein
MFGVGLPPSTHLVSGGIRGFEHSFYAYDAPPAGNWPVMPQVAITRTKDTILALPEYEDIIPLLMPDNIVVGDLLIAFVAYYTGDMDINVPGWTYRASILTGTNEMVIAERTADGTEGRYWDWPISFDDPDETTFFGAMGFVWKINAGTWDRHRPNGSFNSVVPTNPPNNDNPVSLDNLWIACGFAESVAINPNIDMQVQANYSEFQSIKTLSFTQNDVRELAASIRYLRAGAENPLDFGNTGSTEGQGITLGIEGTA